MIIENGWGAGSGYHPYQKTIKNIIFERRIRLTHNVGEKNANCTLTNILWCFSDGECRYPRDKVFGLQALVCKEESIATDYSASIRDVFLRVAAAMLGDSYKRNSRHYKKHVYNKAVKRSLHKLAENLGLDLTQAALLVRS